MVGCSIVVITRNRPGIVDLNLDALAEQTLKPLEVILVDSSEPARQWKQQLERVYPFPVRHFCYPRGLGQMPRARNFGIQQSCGEVVVFLDDDCLASPGWLQSLASCYQRHPEALGVGGLIRDERWKFDPERPIGAVDACGRVSANFFGDTGGACPVAILPGGNMSFRREGLLDVGGFDPGYVATNHREDPDLCLRLVRNGGRLYYEPAAEVLHLAARLRLKELKRFDEFYLRYSYARNEGYFTLKHFGHSPRAWKRICWDEMLAWAREGISYRSAVVLLAGPLILGSKLVGIAQGLSYFLNGKKDSHFE
ncbi:MAG: hypothetical protein AMXMBFR33_46130 [Candidatus Xenobia bacterium]